MRFSYVFYHLFTLVVHNELLFTRYARATCCSILHYGNFQRLLTELLPIDVSPAENAKLTKLDSFNSKKRRFTSNDGQTADEFTRICYVQNILNRIHTYTVLVLLLMVDNNLRYVSLGFRQYQQYIINKRCIISSNANLSWLIKAAQNLY